MPKKRREVTVRLDDEDYERLRQEAFRLRMSHNQAMREALQMWMAAKRQDPKLV
jgi:predicted transcriptional regulator